MLFETPEPPFRFRQGTAPLLISMPHVGTYVPPALMTRFTEEAQELPDTDWHLERLYDFADRLGASVLVATHSRYVVDLNRPPDDTNLYPGQDTTGLCPIDTFDRTPVYAAGAQPDEREIAARVDAIWRPFHAKLEEELSRLKTLHAHVGLWDAHSIQSVLPRFFIGRLPDLNLGTAQGLSCHPQLATEVLRIATEFPAFTSVMNGRFTGGFITRNYGKPSAGISAIQLEMAKACYMREGAPYAYSAERAAGVRPVIEKMLTRVLNFLTVH